MVAQSAKIAQSGHTGTSPYAFIFKTTILQKNWIFQQDSNSNHHNKGRYSDHMTITMAHGQ